MNHLRIGGDQDRDGELRVALREMLTLILWFGSLFGLLLIAHGVLG